jgi:transcription initiation factor TFIID subunit 2
LAWSLILSQVCHPSSSTKSIFRFVQSIPTSVQHISFAVGPFHVVALPPTPSDAALPSVSDEPGADEAAPVEEDTSQPLIHVFVLPGQEDTVQVSTAFIRQGMDFLTTEYGSYPFSTFNLVFVDEPVVPSSAGAAMAIFDSDLLHPKDVIDQAYETRLTLSHALAFQWVGINIVPKTWSDTWLINGLSLYITGLFLRKLLGNNEYRFRLKMDSIRCAEMDNGTQAPICLPGSLDPPDAATLPFVNLKSGLVMHILDRRLGKTGTSLGLSRVIPKIFLSAITGDLANNALSTQAFLRMCRKVSGVDMRSFAEQWIWGSGCPHILVTAFFNKKKMLIEMTCRQTTPAVAKLKDDPVMAGYLKPTPWFEVSAGLHIIFRFIRARILTDLRL